MHRRRGRGLEVHDIRVWSEGDDVRHLDRNVTARTGTPHVRTFRDERERAIMLVFDFRPSMLFGTRRALRSVAAAEALTILAWRIIEDGGRVGLVVATSGGVRRTGWARGPRALVSLIGELAAAHHIAVEDRDVADPPLAEILDEADGVAGAAAMVVATALDAPGDRFDASVDRIARKRELAVILVADRFELGPPPGVYRYQTSDGDAGWLRIGRDGQTAATDGGLIRLRRLGVDCVRLDTGLEAEAMVRVLERLDD